MNLENIRLYLSFLAPALGLLCTTIIFLKKFVKNKRLKRILEKTEAITKEIIPCIMEAERFTNYNGLEKKTYVMTKLNQLAIANNVSFDEESTSSRVEELVSLTKAVNVTNSSNIIKQEAITEKIQENEIEKQIQNIISGYRR